MARALAAGGDRARSSVAQAVKEWQGARFLAGAAGGRGNKQQRAQQPSQQQQRQQHQDGAQQKQRQATQPRSPSTPLGKGRGDQPGLDQRNLGGASTGGGGGKPRGPSSAAAARAKGVGKNRAPWADLVVDEEAPLLLPGGQHARKCAITADSSDEDVERACGYIMASGQTALRMACRVAHRKNRSSPIIIVHQPASDYEKGLLSDQLREYQDQVNDHLHHDDEQHNPLSITIQETSLLLKDASGSSAEPRKVILIHFSDDVSVTTVDQEGADYLGLSIAPELCCPEDADEEIAMTVVRRMCEQLDLKEWADQFFAYSDRKVTVAAVQKLARGGKSDPSLRVRLLADRSVNFHGQHFEEGKVRAILTVPKHEVDDFLGRSGEYGVLYEFADRGRNNSWKKINLPLDWDLNDVITSIAALPVDVRPKVRGFVPTARGYAVRVNPDDEALVTTVLLPELAEQLGPSLGLRPNSAWLLKNLPRRINKQGLIQMLSTENGRWRPWHVLPRYVVSDRNPRYSAWVVDAEGPPPLRAIRARDTFVTIERYVDEKKLSPSMRVWAKPVSQWDRRPEGQKTAARRPWADVADDDGMSDVGGDWNYDLDETGMEDQARGDGTGQKPTPTAQEASSTDQSTTQPGRWTRPRPNQAQAQRPQGRPLQPSPQPTGEAGVIVGHSHTHRRPRNFPLTDSSGTDTSAPPQAKRMFGAPSRRGVAAPITSLGCSPSDLDPEKRAMQAALAEKDAMIATLQESVNRMQRTLEAMLAAMATSGTISPEAAAAAAADARAPQMAVTIQQPQVVPQGTHPHHQGAEHHNEETMWSRADAQTNEDNMDDSVGW